jgi:mono/diheme cytochrome c family protein
MTRPNLNKRQSEMTEAPGTPPSQRGEWPSNRQFFGQLGIVLVIVVVWVALFAGYMTVAGNLLAAPNGVALSRSPSTKNAVSVATANPAANVASVDPGANAQAGGVQGDGASAEAAPAAAAPAAPAATNVPAVASAVSFARDVQPVLQQRCSQCHGARRTAGGVALTSYDQVRQNVTPGDAVNTQLIQLMRDGSMPRNSPPVLPAQIDTIAKWIDAGAPNN